MSEPSAKVIADSISPAGHRLTTMEVRMHRFVLAEFNTHRVFSRNSASSRAIPLKKQLERVQNEPAFPVSWPQEQRGMQGGDELPEHLRSPARFTWHDASFMAVKRAELLGEMGVHKSIANRLLEPFMWHTVIVTSTAWENFFRQRCSPLAQPEIRVAAETMRAAYDESVWTYLEEGYWHLPYVDRDDHELMRWAADRSGSDDLTYWTLLCRVSTARCARVSYLTQDGRRDPEEDLRLYERLVSAEPMHASPLEHVATLAPWNQQWAVIEPDGGIGVVHTEEEAAFHRSLDKKVWGPTPIVGNLLGWRQLRLDVELEKEWVSFS